MTIEKIRNLVAERDGEYAGAWEETGMLLQGMNWRLSAFLQEHPRMYFPWIMILNKLLRALGSPQKKDHWLDIQGYAQLVLDSLEASDDLPSE